MYKWKKEEVEILEKFYVELGPVALLREFFPHLNIDIIKYKGKKLGLCTQKQNHTTMGRYIYDLNNRGISIIDNQKVKGDSVLQCNKCKNTWQACIYDVYHRRQECGLCSNTVGSKIATKWLDELQITNREARIPNTKYVVDGIVGSTVYEFLGDYWHGNPEKFNLKDTNPSTNRTYVDLLQQTISRFEDIKKLGYTIAYIWEDEYIHGRPFSYW